MSAQSFSSDAVVSSRSREMPSAHSSLTLITDDNEQSFRLDATEALPSTLSLSGNAMANLVGAVRSALLKRPFDRESSWMLSVSVSRTWPCRFAKLRSNSAASLLRTDSDLACLRSNAKV